MAEYLGKIHALPHYFNELLPAASTHSQELEQRSKLFMLLALHGLLMIMPIFVTSFWDLLLCLILLLHVPPFFVCQVNTPLIYLLILLMTLQLWYISVMITLTLASQTKGMKSVTIVASLATKLAGVMFYMVTLLNLQHLPKQLLLCKMASLSI